MTVVLSPERAGRITGSRIAAVLGVNRYQKRADVMRDLVREAFGDAPLFDGNEATRHGQAHEADAIEQYERERGVMVHSQQMFVIHPDHDFLAVTVDALVGDDGLVEVKAPFSGQYTHIDQKPDHEAQIRLQLAVTERKWADYCVWREGEPLAVSRVEHDPLWLPAVLSRLEAFIGEYRAVVGNTDRALVVRLSGNELVAELFRQRDRARRIACVLEGENFSLLDTIRDRELAR